MILESRQPRLFAEINVIPLVDVMLVLLVIFMVTAPMLYRGIDVNLPTSATNTIQPAMRTVLTIEKDRRLYLDKDQVGIAQLEQKLKLLKREHPDVSLYLRADREVPYGIVVQIMDGVKKSGIEKIGMVTDPLGFEPLAVPELPVRQSRKK